LLRDAAARHVRDAAAVRLVRDARVNSGGKPWPTHSP